MATGRLVNDFCEETTCSVCLDYFKNPVTTECGHNFCQACLTQCWAKFDTDTSCPQCRVLQQKNFTPNWQLANLVELVKKLQAGKQAEEKWGRCERHQEPLKLFCFDDQAPICVVCDRSMEHQNHRVLPMEEAYLEYKKEIQSQLQSLEQERQKLQEQKVADDQRSQKFLTQLQAEKKKTKLHNYLEKEEHLRLSLLEEMEKAMVKRDEENYSRFSKEVSHLSCLITEMEQKLQQSENEFLQDPKTVQSRYVKEPERQLLGPPLELEEALRTYSRKTPALEEALAKCQESVERILDALLHKDMKSLKWESSKENLPDNPERFDILPSELDHEKFTSGRHCWVVEGGNGESGWAVELRNGESGWAVEMRNRESGWARNINLNPDESSWIVQTECYDDDCDDDFGDCDGYFGDDYEDCGAEFDGVFDGDVVDN